MKYRALDPDCWTGFHNDGSSQSAARNLPMAWTPDKGIAWFADLPGYGQSAPVIWKSTVFITTVQGENKEKNQVTAYEVATGKVRWQKEFSSSQPVRAVYTVSRAAPTPALDKNALFVFFESGDLIALSHDGRVLWQRSLTREYGNIKGGHGIGASPAQTEDTLILLVEDVSGAYLLAVDKRTGKNRWKVERKAQNGWSSPVLLRAGSKTEVVVSSGGAVQGYALADGAKVWEVSGLTGNNIPTPAVLEDRIYIGASTSARQAGGASAAESNCCLVRKEQGGQVSCETVWRATKAVCSYMGPLLSGDCAYYVNGTGILFCLDAKSGQQHYAERIDGECWAQPIATKEHLYFFAKNGSTTVVKPGPRFEKVASNRLWTSDSLPLPSARDAAVSDPNARQPSAEYLDPIVYGAAIAGDRIFVRVGTRLYCIRKG